MATISSPRYVLVGKISAGVPARLHYREPCISIVGSSCETNEQIKSRELQFINEPIQAELAKRLSRASRRLILRIRSP